jgi:4'-phosphopantetheinyl transferase
MTWLGIFNVAKWNENEQWDSLLNSVDAKEQERIKRFRFRIDAKRSLAGLTLAKEYLTKEHRDNFKIARTEENRPYCQFTNERDFICDFNVSHSGDYVAMGMLKSSTQRGKVLGVDIEQVQLRGNTKLADFLQDMESCFTKLEWNIILSPYTTTHGNSLTNMDAIANAYTRHEVLSRFFLFWTLKESFIKAIGIGVGFELQKAEFRFSGEPWTAEAELYVRGSRCWDWQFKSFVIKDQGTSDHIMSVAVGPIDDENVSPNVRSSLSSGTRPSSMQYDTTISSTYLILDAPNVQ